MKPKLNPGEYVFCTVENPASIDRTEVIGEFKEAEGTTIILGRDKADEHGLPYHFIGAWITLEVHSALEAVGLTAAFSSALAEHNISCNVVAGYFHDHIFVDYDVREKALSVLKALAQNSNNPKSDHE